MTRRGRVCVVGSLHYDIMVRASYLPRVGETLVGERWWWKPGGKGGNQAMAAARHGADTTIIGSLGDDEFGLRLRERLGAAGVDLRHLRTVSEGSGMSVAIEQADGDYAAVVVSGANRGIDTRQVADGAEAITGSTVLSLQNEISEAADVAAARLAHDAGRTVVLNAAPARPLHDLAGLVDVLIVNAVEAEMLGTGPVDDLASAVAAVRTLSSLAPLVVVTAGAAGVAAGRGSETIRLAAHRIEGARSHGAGDVFAGALAAQLAGSARPEPAIRYANAAAALHVAASEADREAIGPADVRRLASEHPGG